MKWNMITLHKQRNDHWSKQDPESTRAKFSISNNSNTIKTIFFFPIFRQTQILSKFRITRVPAYCFLFFAAFPLLYLLAIYNGRGGNLPKIRN